MVIPSQRAHHRTVTTTAEQETILALLRHEVVQVGLRKLYDAKSLRDFQPLNSFSKLAPMSVPYFCLVCNRHISYLHGESKVNKKTHPGDFNTQ